MEFNDIRCEMKQHRRLLIPTIVLFVIINTNYYWDGMLGIWMIPVMLFLFVIVVILVFALFRQMYLAIKEKFKVQSRLYLIVIMLSAFLVSVYLPYFFDPERLEAKDLLIAQHIGSANCTTTLKLKQGNEFYERSVCFGISKITGTYTIQNDTIKFTTEGSRDGGNIYKFGVIKKKTISQNEKILGELYLYRGINDTIPNILFITKNELKN